MSTPILFPRLQNCRRNWWRTGLIQSASSWTSTRRPWSPRSQRRWRNTSTCAAMIENLHSTNIAIVSIWKQWSHSRQPGWKKNHPLTSLILLVNGIYPLLIWLKGFSCFDIYWILQRTGCWMWSLGFLPYMLTAVWPHKSHHSLLKMKIHILDKIPSQLHGSNIHICIYMWPILGKLCQVMGQGIRSVVCIFAPFFEVHWCIPLQIQETTHQQGLIHLGSKNRLSFADLRKLSFEGPPV